MRHREGIRAACWLAAAAMMLAGCEQGEQGGQGGSNVGGASQEVPATRPAGVAAVPPPRSVHTPPAPAPQVLGGPAAAPAGEAPASAPDAPARNAVPSAAAPTPAAPAKPSAAAPAPPQPLPIPLPDPLVASISPPGPSAAEAQRDARITARVNARLAADPGLASMKVAVETHRGIVTLRGVARSAAALARAGDIAHGVPEVRGVDNEIVLRAG